MLNVLAIERAAGGVVLVPGALKQIELTEEDAFPNQSCACPGKLVPKLLDISAYGWLLVNSPETVTCSIVSREH